MKNSSMKIKLIALCSFFLSIIILTNTYETFQIHRIVQQLNDISKTQLPAVRKMTLTDMHHEGVMGIVYKMIYAVEVNDESLKNQASTEYYSSSKEMRDLLQEIDSLNLKQETKKAIAEAMPAIDLYLKTAEDIIILSNTGKRAEALAKIPDFNKSFSILEESLNKLSGLIEADALTSEKKGDQLASNGKNVSSILTILSLLIGITASIIIVKNLMQSISEAVENLSHSVHDVQNTAQLVNLVSNKLSTSVDTQASSITESVTAMDEISAMIKNNDKSAMNASHLSELTKSSAESGKDTVSKMLNEMKDIAKSYDEIKSSTEKNKEDINKIVDVITQIATKTEVINDIVFQTKLLSFNASVEAARAGESGKGFAVVAEEIGKLAQMSGKASHDIEEMLKASQDQVKQLAELTTTNIEKIVQNGRSKIQNGNEVANECMRELEKIHSCAFDLDSSINEISTAIKEQSIGVDEVNLALKQLNDATHESTDMATKSKTASVALQKQAHDLRSTIQSLRKILGAKKNYEAPPLE